MVTIVEKWKRDLAVLRRYGADAQAGVLASCIADFERTSSPADSGVYTVREVADLLNLHPQTVYGLIRERKLRALKIGRSVRIPRDAVEQYAATPGGVAHRPPTLAVAR